ncbi:MAG TPA: protein translocase subunit SecF [Stellaceae bacterium]|jgi:preprotein translocase subunit SecF|nr:protein translocase subunit SecF [Stellaceae bacterium]
MRPVFVFLRHPPSLPFVKVHMAGFVLSIIMVLASIGLLATKGLNFGIDFRGGIVMEVKNPKGPVDLEAMRAKLNGLGLGDVSLQTFGAPDDVLIRLQRQPGGDEVQNLAANKVRTTLGSAYDYRRTEVVGPTVGAELIHAGTEATILAMIAISIYVWFRFKWQFGLGAIVSTFHDVITTLGLFSLLQLDFNLPTIAAILTVAGYSINDTVIIYDRVRETLRKYKTMEMGKLIDLALNETLSRTTMTAAVTALAVLALLLFGGAVIRSFSAAMLWGIVVGTYSSLFVAAPMLLYFKPERTGKEAAKAASAPAPSTKG